ncbi:MAG TPA: tRNA pseudouridine(38-40) synthase TruA [Vicinamibacterales bacterium]|nr:tRNA pseudouridine(38-40) synthase TruA [Vicinamibacterales bacterium]
MPRFRLRLEYNGTRYSGWQIQANARTVQGTIAAALVEILRTDRFELYGAGRTDAGVHALGQVAHLDTAVQLPPRTLERRLNDALPSDINILEVALTDRRFHARRSAVARSYLYQIARRRTAFGKPFVWWIREPLDVARMREAAGRFAGLHDFRSFTDEDPEAKSTRVLIERLQIVERGALILIRLEGSHFLWKMARRIVGVLAAAGRGEIGPDDIARWLAEPSPEPARLTAPAAGLFLERVYYPGEPRLGEPEGILNL